jgi:hypothetical protein
MVGRVKALGEDEERNKRDGIGGSGKHRSNEF